MRTSRPLHQNRFISSVGLIRISVFVALVALVTLPLFAVSSASLAPRFSPVNVQAPGANLLGATKVSVRGARQELSANLTSLSIGRPAAIAPFALMPQATPTPSIATFDGTGGTCGAAKAEFNLGQQVCATATATGGSAARRRITWQDPDGFVRQSTAITTDPQSDNFTIPNTPTSTLSNGQVVHNLGNWRVNLVGRSLVSYATFVVKDPANATADLSVTKIAPANSQQVAAGSNGSFNIYVQNGGPDDAATVTVTDHVPDNTMFVAMIQTSGAPQVVFSCTDTPDGNNNITCSIDTLAAGASATFNFVYTVNAGTPAGTLITNTVSIASATTNELNNSDNSATASASVTSGGGGTGICTIDCPEDIVTQSNTTDPNNPNQPGAIVHFDAPTTDGTCGTVTIDHCNDCFFPQGNTLVTARATTGDSCSFNVTVTAASNAPTISCPPNKEVDAHGDCQVQVDVGTATATGGQNVTIFGTRSDGKPLYTCDANGQNCVRVNPDFPFAGGVTTITWTATSHDAQGAEIGSSSCMQTITVDNASDDTTPPVITCPANITRSTDPGQCSAMINVGTATATDHCDSSPEVVGTRSDNQPLSAPYPKGTTTITWTATDSSGNQSSCNQTITVNDTEPPAITCPANISTNTDPGTCSATVNPGTATATDNCDNNPTVTGTRSDNQPLNAPYPKGTTTITWTATDHASPANQSSCTQTVTVQDHEAPVITCPANITRSNDPGMCSANINPGTATATDNCDTPTVTGTRSDNQPLNSPYPVGTTTITWTASDTSGNNSSCTQTITVNDTEPPTITCPANITLEPTCPTGAVGTYTAPVGTDNCPGATTTRTAGGASGSVFPIGTTTVTYTVNDAHGNSTSCSFTVTVKSVTQTIEDLKTSVNNSSLSPSNKGGLVNKLQAAEDALAAGHTNTACQKLADFINSTQNLISHGDISAAVGNAWISTAAHVRNTIGCTNDPCS